MAYGGHTTAVSAVRLRRRLSSGRELFEILLLGWKVFEHVGEWLRTSSLPVRRLRGQLGR